ncbi:MAG: hypothetical protein U9P80_06910 [Thermodesulfobacteriota bacterium]|nr:hypothetical protein [Thermodesulfobacteriota bacterium]
MTMIERIPFLHRATAYNIIIEGDIGFDALHYILDALLADNVFEVDEGDADLVRVSYGGVQYVIAVDGMDVMIAVE